DAASALAAARATSGAGVGEGVGTGWCAIVAKVPAMSSSRCGDGHIVGLITYVQSPAWMTTTSVSAVALSATSLIASNPGTASGWILRCIASGSAQSDAVTAGSTRYASTKSPRFALGAGRAPW